MFWCMHLNCNQKLLINKLDDDFSVVNLWEIYSSYLAVQQFIF